MAGSEFVEAVKYFTITPKRTGYANNVTGIDVSGGTSNPPTVEKGVVVKVTFRVPKTAFDPLADVVIEIAPPNTQAMVEELKDIAEATS